ncbi:protein obstructor-E [Hyalella azteca]|uniref:Protein obstructor-E n=1 Tax=Hyalella azteca TaxID=294128 RepID=A0A8B7P788_HYAAZ|nr:protein obstructor-E [Hyalella azteca]
MPCLLQYYKCANGTLTEELCEHGLLYDGKGNVFDNCNYHWAVNCDGRYSDVVPHTGGACEYDFGIFSAGACETYYRLCEHGVPLDYPCTAGLAYDERIHACNWPDLMLETCKPEQVVGFSCPDYVDPKSLSAKFLPFPRFPSGECGSYIICVDGHPRRIGCGDYQVFDDETLSCQDPEHVPSCRK